MTGRRNRRAGIGVFTIRLTRHTAFQVTLLSEHLRDEEDNDCPEDASSGQQVHEGITGSRQ